MYFVNRLLIIIKLIKHNSHIYILIFYYTYLYIILYYINMTNS